MTLDREIVFQPAFDKRSPDPGKNYGIHGVTMTWYLKGISGAIQFVVYTNWQLPHVTQEMEIKAKEEFIACLWEPMAADIGYHSHVPMYEGQPLMTDHCEVINGPCYYDGSSLQADDGFKILLENGGEAVWEWMEEYYNNHFCPDTSEKEILFRRFRS